MAYLSDIAETLSELLIYLVIVIGINSLGLLLIALALFFHLCCGRKQTIMYHHDVKDKFQYHAATSSAV